MAARFALNGDEGVALLKIHLHHPGPSQKETMMAWSWCCRKRPKVPEIYELAIRIYSPRVSVFLELQRSVHEAVAIELTVYKQIV